MAFPSVTYTFTNGTTADATQVNQNFTDLINGLSDGTKSINISAITAASTTTLNGAVNLGAGSANAIAVNGSISTDIPFQSNAGQAIGGLTLGIKALYLGGNSTYTIKLAAPGGMAAAYTATMPAAVPSGTSAVTMDSSGNLATVLGGFLPPGVTLPYFGTAAPSGFLLCDGSAVSRTTYAALFAVIGTACGNGDGSTTFNVPDLRGRFLRGVDSTAGRDPDKASRTAMATGGNTGNAVGSVQAQATAKNGLTLTDPGHAHNEQAGSGGGGASVQMAGATAANNPSGVGSVNSTGTATTGITLSGDNETRPLNAYVTYIIKT